MVTQRVSGNPSNMPNSTVARRAEPTYVPGDGRVGKPYRSEVQPRTHRRSRPAATSSRDGRRDVVRQCPGGDRRVGQHRVYGAPFCGSVELKAWVAQALTNYPEEYHGALFAP